MQRNPKHLKAAKPAADLTPAQLLQKQADEAAYQAKINAYLEAQKNQEPNSKSFKLMPFQHIASFLPLSDAKRFAYTCRAVLFSQNMQPTIERATNAVHQFLVHVRNANLSAVNTMLQTDPGLLLEKQIFGEHGKVTGLQLAKRMGDAGMCRMMLNRLLALDAEYDTNHTSAQIKNVAANPQKKAPFDEKYFDDAADAIARNKLDAAAEKRRHRHPDQPRTNLSNDMDAYRRACDAHGEFTAEDLINVFDALVRNAGKFTTYEEFDLYFLQVMGYVARKIPMCLRLALDQGIADLMNDHAPLNRHIYIHDPYSLVDSPQNSGLGFDFTFNFYDNLSGGVSIEAPRNWFYLSFPFCRSVCLKELGRPLIEKFSQTTEAEFVDLMLQPAPEPEKKKRCCRW